MIKKLKFPGLCAAVFIVSFVSAGLIMGRGSASDTFPTAHAAIEERPFEEASLHYTVGEYLGKVAVFLDDSTSPSVITDISADTLRAADRALLLQGIDIFSHDEVLRLLEDLGS